MNLNEPVNVTDAAFEKVVLKSALPVVVDFWAPWCGPCRAVAPVVDELAKEYKGKVEFAKLNVDEAPFIASKYSIMSIPTLMIFKEGKPVENVIGFKPKAQLQKLLDKTLGK